MSAAFLVERGTPRKMSSSADFISKEQEEEGLKFSMENAAEDIVNTLFCTYEPPTSKKMQYSEVIAPAPEGRDDDVPDERQVVMVDPGNRKSVTWRDQQREKEERTEIENKVVDLASKYCGGVFNQGDHIAEVLSSPQGRATQSFFSGGPDTPGSMANMASSLFGGKTAASEVSAATSADATMHTQTKIMYDDLGNPIREDDVDDDDAQVSYFPSTPKDPTAAAVAPATPSPSRVNKRNGHQNLFCSNIPFMDTVMTGIGIAGVMAASAAAKAGVPDNYCGNVYTKPTRKSATQEQISEELKEAQEALGVYEPENYDQPNFETSNLKRQSTPRFKKRNGTPRNLNNDEEEDILESLLNNEDGTEERDGSSLPTSGRRQDNPYSSQRSYANSDITMGSTTIKHFGGAANGNASLFDDLLGEDGSRSPHATKSHTRSPSGGSINSFSSMVEELKHVQKERILSGRSQDSRSFNFSKNNTNDVGVSVSSIKNSYEKSCKSPRKAVVTTSYLNYIKKSPVKSKNGGNALPATPNHNRNTNDPELSEIRTGAVASLAKQFESPRSIRQAAVRKSVDPSESRFFDGTVDLLPPTPRRKAPETMGGYGVNSHQHTWGTNNAPTPNNRSNNNYNAVPADMASPQSVHTHNTDAEVREAPSTILDVNPKRNNRPKFAGRRPRSLVTGPETVKENSQRIEKNNESPEEDNNNKASNDNSKKNKRDKSKERKSFADKLKKSVGKALNPVKSVTRKVEASRISSGD
eukprot:jgi/Psemu1/326260/estExt_fgenesh1_pg.C_3540018